MKKLLLAIIAILIAVLFIVLWKYRRPIVNRPPTTKQVSLNGVDSLRADTLKKEFIGQCGHDNTEKTISIWFSYDVLHNIVKLLDAELSVQLTHPHTLGKDTTYGLTDGIRIYYVNNPATIALPLSTPILLVPTTDHGFADHPCLSGKAHLDYYTHSADADLFKLGSAINGQVSVSHTVCVGDSLYFPKPPRSVMLCEQTTPHGISRQVAQEMVQSCKKDAVNSKADWFDLGLFRIIDKYLKPGGGIRIYFARNIKDTTSISLRHAFVITTTMWNPTTGTNTDDFKCNKDSKNNAIYEAYKAYLKSKYPDKVLGLDPQDKGELCPDNCNPGDGTKGKDR